MNRRSLQFAAFVLAASVNVSATLAQNPAPPPAAPIPRAILTAKRIFIANAGADSGLFPHPFSGDPDRGYSQFYAELNATGQFKLVDDPSDADLVLELRLTAPYGPSQPNKIEGASDPLPMFRLVIYKASTHQLLWAITEAIDSAGRQKTHDRNYDDALKAIRLDFESLTGKAPPPAPTR